MDLKYKNSIKMYLMKMENLYYLNHLLKKHLISVYQMIKYCQRKNLKILNNRMTQNVLQHLNNLWKNNISWKMLNVIVKVDYQHLMVNHLNLQKSNTYELELKTLKKCLVIGKMIQRMLLKHQTKTVNLQQFIVILII